MWFPLIALLATAAPDAPAETPAAQVDHALKLLGEQEKEPWAFRVTEHNASKSRTRVIHRVTGQLPVLESVDGRAPTDDERDELKAHQHKGKEKNHDLAEAIDKSSLKSCGERTFCFHVQACEALDGIDPDQLAGSLALDAEGRAKRLELHSVGPFRAKVIAHIDKFTADLDFAPVAGTDVVMPSHSRVEVHGTLAVFKSIDEVETLSFSDYTKAKPPAPDAGADPDAGVK